MNKKQIGKRKSVSTDHYYNANKKIANRNPIGSPQEKE
jgi:hypothetical protein